MDKALGKTIRRPGVHSWLSCQIFSCHNSQDALDSPIWGQKDIFPNRCSLSIPRRVQVKENLKNL